MIDFIKKMDLKQKTTPSVNVIKRIVSKFEKKSLNRSNVSYKISDKVLKSNFLILEKGAIESK